jgi:Ca2+-binding EF-hand superfamily protein
MKLREIQQCFYLNETTNPSTGLIPNDRIGTLMKMLGTNPTTAELPDIYKKIDPENTGTVNQC